MDGFDISDISMEIWREYIYPNGVLHIKEPKMLYRKTSNLHSHRVVTASGETYYPAPGWIGLSWYAPSNPVSF